MGEISNNLTGFELILSTLWPFMAIAYLANVLAPLPFRLRIATGGAVFIVATVGLLEWMQMYLPGRFADVTTILLAVAGWAIPWRWRVDASLLRQSAFPRGVTDK